MLLREDCVMKSHYQPIDNYGVIGNLVSVSGWSSPSSLPRSWYAFSRCGAAEA